MLRIGPLAVDPPVVLAPMAGVTNSPFRRLCRDQLALGLGPAGAGDGVTPGLFVSEMVSARALVENNARTAGLAAFAPDEVPRSLQLYGTDPAVMGEAVRRLVADDRVDHLDLNFGCPARKITRHGGGSAVPLRPRLFAAIVAAAVGAAGPVPVTVKMRLGLDDGLRTHIEAGRAAADAGAAAVAVHARTAEQLYSGTADWRAIAELRDAVRSVPVLGNGDIWEAADAVAMMDQTGCDGVVVGRGCLGRPWLFRDLAAALGGRPVPPPPTLHESAALLAEHGRLLSDWFGEEQAMREIRKHTGWYLQGFAVGAATRRALRMVSSRAELDGLLGALGPDVAFPDEARRMKRGHTAGPRPVTLPEGWLDDLDSLVPPGRAAELVVSGG